MKQLNLENKRFGKLIVLNRDNDANISSWICKCDCGKILSVPTYLLTSGRKMSCGCLRKEKGIKLYEKYKKLEQENKKLKTDIHNIFENCKYCDKFFMGKCNYERTI